MSIIFLSTRAFYIGQKMYRIFIVHNKMLKYIFQFFLHFSILYGHFLSNFSFLSMCFSYLIVGFLEKVI